MLVSGIVMATVISAAVVLVALQYSSTTTLEWNVEQGTTLTYLIQVSGFTSQGDPLNITSRGPPPFCDLNNSKVTVEVTWLPEVPPELNGASFSELMIETTKTTLVSPVRYMNGTEVIDPPYELLNDLVSQCLLPIGGWSLLDSFYPDEPNLEFACNTYISRFEVEGFLVGHRYFNIDSGHGWIGTIALETGIPLTAEVWASQYYGNDWFSYHIVLTLT